MSVFLQRTGLLGSGAALPAFINPTFSNIVLLIDDGADEATTFTDLSSFGHSLSREGTPHHDDGSVAFAGDTSSLLFAADGGINCGDHDEYDLFNDYGMDYWVKFTSAVQKFAITKYNSTSQRAFQCRIGPAAVFHHFSQRGSSSSFASSSGDLGLNDDEWHHIYFVHEVYDSGTKQRGRIFVDGILYEITLNTNLPIDATTSPIWIGQDDKDLSQFAGRIAWPRIWHGEHGHTEDFAVPTSSPPLS